VRCIAEEHQKAAFRIDGSGVKYSGIAIDANPNANRARPLCEWPAWPKFTGAPGDENDAASYTCTAE
jgi:hypothetical protein